MDDELEVINPPILTIQAIKKILLQEYQEFKTTLYSILEFQYKKDYWNDAIYSIQTEIENCITYNDVDEFVSKH